MMMGKHTRRDCLRLSEQAIEKVDRRSTAFRSVMNLEGSSCRRGGAGRRSIREGRKGGETARERRRRRRGAERGENRGGREERWTERRARERGEGDSREGRMTC